MILDLNPTQSYSTARALLSSVFANTFELTERGIRGIIADLEKHGYIRLMYKRDSSGKVIERRIYLNVSAPEEQPEENIFPTPGKTFPQDGEQIFRYTNPSKTVDKKKNTKKKPDPLTIGAGMSKMDCLTVWRSSTIPPARSRKAAHRCGRSAVLTRSAKTL